MRCKHDWCYKEEEYGYNRDVHEFLKPVLLFTKPDFFRRWFVCSECGKTKYVDVKNERRNG